MKRYNIIDTTIEFMKDVEIPFDFSSYEVGDDIEIIGNKLTLNQKGTVMALSNSEQIIVMQETKETNE